MQPRLGGTRYLSYLPRLGMCKWPQSVLAFHCQVAQHSCGCKVSNNASFSQGTRQTASAPGSARLVRDTGRLCSHPPFSQAGFLAQKRLARGLRLNQTEAVALIASQLQERIRDGKHSVADLMQHGRTLLGRRHVLPGVPTLLHEIQVEGTFEDG